MATKAISPETSQLSYKPIDVTDLYVSPSKYIGRAIEIKNIRCYHADKDEYRCTASDNTPIVLFTIAITPDTQKYAVENDCGEIKQMASSSNCLKIARFIPLKNDEDIVSGYRKRVIILAKSIELTPQIGSRRNR